MKTYIVTRMCCRTGLCVDCHARGNHGDKTKRLRIVQAGGLSKSMAQRYMIGWADLEPQMEEVSNGQNRGS
jgi:hypothetical protein